VGSDPWRWGDGDGKGSFGVERFCGYKALPLIEGKENARAKANAEERKGNAEERKGQDEPGFFAGLGLTNPGTRL
jgi:hypothetical protein